MPGSKSQTTTLESLPSRVVRLETEIERLRELLRGFREHYGDPVWHDRVWAEIGPAKEETHE